jgi:hypothetical protein
MRKSIIIILFLCSCLTMRAQMSFQFIPELQGRNLDGLLQVKIMNPGNQASARLTIRVTAKGQGEVVKIIVPGVLLNTGVNSITPGSVGKAAISFSSLKLSTIVKQSNLFPEAEYEYCYLLEDEKVAGIIGEECFDYNLEPLSPLSLIEPFNTQRICERKPMLSWQPIFPAIAGLQYQLTLAEVKTKQAAVEALYYNIPLINVRNIPGSYLPYPASARDLDTGKTYVWQVTAYKGEVIISRSEVWTFKVGCDEQIPLDPPAGFRDIEDLVMGNYYIAEGRVLFSIDNPYTEMKLDYSFECLTEPETKFRKLPEINLIRGRNNVIIPLEETRAFKDGNIYLLKVRMPNGTYRSLRFTFKNKS